MTSFSIGKEIFSIQRSVSREGLAKYVDEIRKWIVLGLTRVKLVVQGAKREKERFPHQKIFAEVVKTV